MDEAPISSPNAGVTRDGALRVACVQMQSGADKQANVECAERLVGAAAGAGRAGGAGGAGGAGAQLVVLPEHWNATGDGDVLRASAEVPDTGPTVAAMARWAQRWAITLVGGSIIERDSGSQRLYNTAFVFGQDGEMIGRYRKIHMFDVDVGGSRYRESELTTPGSELLIVDAAGWRVGISLCYDVRFPELYRALAARGAQVIAVPAYFTVATGRDHWDLLLRTRAVENQLYVLAAGQCGEPAPGKPAYGRSLVCDPWGIVLARAADEEAVVPAQLHLGRIRAVRAGLPALANRRQEVYASWEQPAAT